MNNQTSRGSEDRARIVNLVTKAEAIIESLEQRATDLRWSMTAFNRYRACELLGIAPYGPYAGDLDADPAALFDEAAAVVSELEVPIEDLGWRLALTDALEAAATDVRMVQDARDV